MIVNPGLFGQVVAKHLHSIGYSIKYVHSKGDARVLHRVNLLDSEIGSRGDEAAKLMAKSDLGVFLLNVSRYYVEIVGFDYIKDFFCVSPDVFRKLILTLQNAYHRIGACVGPTPDSCFDEFVPPVYDVTRILPEMVYLKISEPVVECPLEIRGDFSIAVFVPCETLHLDDFGLVSRDSRPVQLKYVTNQLQKVLIDCVADDRVVVSICPEVGRFLDVHTCPAVRTLMCNGYESYRDAFSVLFGCLYNVHATIAWTARFNSQMLLAEKGAGKSTCTRLIRDYGILVIEDEELMKTIPCKYSPELELDKWRIDIAGEFVELVIRIMMTDVPMIWSVSNYEWFVSRCKELDKYHPLILVVDSNFRHANQTPDQYKAKRARDRSLIVKMSMSGIRFEKHKNLPEVFFDARKLKELSELGLIRDVNK